MKKLLFIFVSIIMFLPNVKAQEECSYAEISRLRTLASLIKFEIKYIGESSQDEYGLEISNVYEDFYIYVKGETFFGNGLIKGFKPKKSYKIVVASYDGVCSKKFDYTHYVTIPAYNIYYKSSYCEKNENIELCQIDYDSSNLTEEQFKKKIDEYMQLQTQDDIQVEKNEDRSMLFIIIGIFVTVSIIVIGVIIVIKNRKKHLL